MKPTFYLSFRSTAEWSVIAFSAFLWLGLSLPGCGSEANGSSGDPASQADPNQSAAPVLDAKVAFQTGKAQAAYRPVPREQLIDRYLEKLVRGDRKSLRFAKQALGELGEAAVPKIVAGLRSQLTHGGTAAVNFMSALSYTKTTQDLQVLLEVLHSHPLPMARSQALDTIGILKQKQLLSGVLDFATRETEGGPMHRLLPCLSKLDGEGGAVYLGQIVEDWLAGPGYAEQGGAAWKNLLAMENPAAIKIVESLVSRMPPSMRAAGITRLIYAGRDQWLPEVRGFLDSEKYPAASLRRKAVEGLAVAGDWEGVMLAKADSDFQVRVSVVDALRMPYPAAQKMGQDFLQEMASSRDETAAYPALRALLERGESAALEPWLALVKGYPTSPGSVGATRLFLQPGISHPLMAELLMDRWGYCDADFRIDITRVLARHPSDSTLQFMEQVVLDPDEDPDVRFYTIGSLGNSGAASIPALLRIWQADPGPKAMQTVLSSLLRFPDDPRVRAFASELAVNPDSPSWARGTMLASLANAFGEDAYPILLQAREACRRDDARLFIEELLHDYF
jgi:HEAT repeat protein